MRLQRMRAGRAAATSVVVGAVLASGLAVLAPQLAGANIVLPPDPSWVTNISQGNNRDDGFKVRALAKMGNVVYVGGSFTQIAPDNKAFAGLGGSSGTPNDAGIDQPFLFAVDATTGGAIQSFRPRLNDAVQALEVNPATNTVYVGGQFTTVNGVPQNGFAILDGVSGAFKAGVTQRSFLKAPDPGTVWGLRLVGTKLYVGGSFTSIPGCGAVDCNRGELARFDVSTNATTLDAIKVYVQAGKVQAIAVDPDNPQYLYIGGQFTGARATSAGAVLANSAFMVAYNVSDPTGPGALVTNWLPAPQSPPPGPGGVVRPPEVRDIEARAGLVYAAVGGGGGKFYVFNGVQAGANTGQFRKLINTDGDVQTLAMTPDGSRVFAGGHFTRLDTSHDVVPTPPNDRCEMFSVNTVSTGPANQQFAIQPQPYMSNGGHYGPFAIIADSASDTWWGGQLTILQPGWVPTEDSDPLTPPLYGPASCGFGDQKNKLGQTSAGYVGGLAHLRQTPGFSDTVAPSTAPTITAANRWVFDGMTLSWTPSADDRGISAYYVRATGPGLIEAEQIVATQWGSNTSLDISPARFQPNATYTLKVCAIDLGDNERCSAAVASSTGAGPPSLPSPLKGFGQFNPVVPDRILDTRIGLGGVVGPVGANTPVSVTVTGGPAAIPTTAGAVVLNVTIVAPSAGGYLTTYPNGQPLPNASNLNFNAGQTVPNLVVARVGTNGAVNFQLSGASGHVLMDVVGWYGSGTTATAGSRLETLSPVRKLDSRSGLGMPGNAARTIGAGETINVKVGTGITGVVLNLTGVLPSAGTYVTAFPGDVATRPNASNLNLVPGQIRPNLVMVKVPTTGPNAGSVNLFNASGNVHLLVDVVAQYKQGSTGDPAAGRILPLDTPMRVVDTRLGLGPIGAQTVRTNDFSVIEEATAPSVVGLVLNVTAVGATASTYLSLFPGGEAVPNASNLNVVPGAAIPNLAVSRLSAQDDLNIYNDAGSVQYLYDVTALVLG